MQLFEFTVKGPPISLQGSSSRKRLWKDKVMDAARQDLDPGFRILTETLAVTITFYYEGETPDVDNIPKPILDALKGIIYNDDSQILDVRCRKKLINSSYRIRGVSGKLLLGFSNKDEFLHIVINKSDHSESLED